MAPAASDFAFVALLQPCCRFLIVSPGRGKKFLKSNRGLLKLCIWQGTELPTPEKRGMWDGCQEQGSKGMPQIIDDGVVSSR
jgi:hypothetical protein